MTRKKHRDAPASDSEINQLRSVLGSLNWVARVCRPDIAYQLSALQTVQKKAVVQDLMDCNALLRYVQGTPELGMFYKYGAYELETAVILSITDASHGADADVSKSGEKLGLRSQSGRILCLADQDFMQKGSGVVHIIEYHSNVIRRVCRSTLQSETLSMVQGYEEGEHLRSVLHGLRHDHHGNEWKIKAMDSVHLYQITDCRSLEAHLHQAGTGTTGDKRLAIDLSALRQVLWRQPGEEFGDPLYCDKVPENGTTHAVWVETKTMVADGLTKKMKCVQLQTLLLEGTLTFDMNKENSKKQMAKERSELQNETEFASVPSLVCKENLGCEIWSLSMHFHVSIQHRQDVTSRHGCGSSIRFGVKDAFARASADSVSARVLKHGPRLERCFFFLSVLPWPQDFRQNFLLGI